jgi:sialate O-acetylesterase
VLHALRTVPHTGMAVTIDTGDPRNVHPPNKQEPGRRLALAALAVAYGRDLVYSGPILKEARFREDDVTLTFDHVGGGLVLKDDAPAGFELAGADRRFVPARAHIEGDAVVLAAPDGRQPAAVRYAWANNPACILYNKEGLPASPFRVERTGSHE